MVDVGNLCLTRSDQASPKVDNEHAAAPTSRVAAARLRDSVARTVGKGDQGSNASVLDGQAFTAVQNVASLDAEW
ncbi:hypothetical protein CPLU01_08842 [Colletotrichum plurivorum]|uniref:Uncharacterized protein n=1 Tax=Colletotrichum plurivorum TaxID=2175906 RepID=A0A8H6KBE3_9PEZI|nr:hypothetical protein CPLU01_08842 [Colletotrichum plurivorum]